VLDSGNTTAVLGKKKREEEVRTFSWKGETREPDSVWGIGENWEEGTPGRG